MEVQIQLTMIIPLTHITQEQKQLQSLTPSDLTLTTLSIPGARMIRRSMAVIPTGTIGRLRRIVAAAPTTCT